MALGSEDRLRCFLLSCRILYVGRENFRFNDRWLLFGLFCLATTVALITQG